MRKEYSEGKEIAALYERYVCLHGSLRSISPIQCWNKDVKGVQQVHNTNQFSNIRFSHFLCVCVISTNPSTENLTCFGIYNVQNETIFIIFQVIEKRQVIFIVNIAISYYCDDRT